MGDGHKHPTRNVRSTHTWQEVTAEGEKREVRAVKFAGAFKIQSKPRRETVWTYHKVPSMEHLLELREIIFRKYQRHRVPYEDLGAVDEMIRLRGEE